jgi:hypothetical protein
MVTSSEKNRPDSVTAKLQDLEKRHRALLRELQDLGLVLRGTIAARMTRCGNPTCRCHAQPPVLHGPYFIWTRKVAAKTVTKQLTTEQAAWCQQWNTNMHRLDEIVRQLQALGQQAAEIVLR